MLSFKIFYIHNNKNLYSVGHGIGMAELIKTLKTNFPQEFKEENYEDLVNGKINEVIITIEPNFKNN